MDNLLQFRAIAVSMHPDSVPAGGDFCGLPCSRNLWLSAQAYGIGSF
jgi:hypothetical protein